MSETKTNEPNSNEFTADEIRLFQWEEWALSLEEHFLKLWAVAPLLILSVQRRLYSCLNRCNFDFQMKYFYNIYSFLSLGSS